jgi:tetratricopeptide (TPR) repeat protein
MNAKVTEKEQAIGRCEAYLRHDPKNPVLLTMLGDLYHQAGRFDEALAHHQKCLADNPTHTLAFGRIANVQISQHRFHEAEQTLRQILDVGESDPALLHNLGLSLYYQQRWQEALDAFERARQLGLNDAKNALYRAYARHHLADVAGATEACQESLALAPSNTANGYLALLQMDSGDMLSAHELAQAVLAREPDNTDAALVEGMWFAEQQEPDRARE